MLLLVINIFTFIDLAFAQKTDNSNTKKLYIASIKATDVPVSFANRVRSNLMLSIFENYGDKYRILDDEAIRVMYAQTAVIMASGGCNDDSCIMQIADGINADEIVYGDVSRVGTKIEINIKCLERKATTVSTKSIVKIAFYESQLDYAAIEAAKKIIDPDYKIDLTENPELQERIKLGGIEIKPVKNLDISVISFKPEDETAAKIIDYMKSFVLEGDNLYNKQDYRKARNKYFEILEKVETKLSLEKQDMIKDYVEGINKRINSSYIMEFKPEIEKIDTWIKEIKDPNIDNFEDGLKKYTKIESDVNKISDKYFASREQLLAAIRDRKDSLYIAISEGLEKKGDIVYRDYQFSDAINWYKKAENKIKMVQNDSKKNYEFQRINKKIKTTQDTGRSYLLNRVKSLVDQAEFYNFQDKNRDAKKIMEEARNLIKGPQWVFVSESTLNAYNKTARVLKIEEIVSDEEKERQAYEKLNSIPNSLFSYSYVSAFINAPLMYGFSLFDVDKVWFTQNKVTGVGIGLSLFKFWYLNNGINYEEKDSPYGEFEKKESKFIMGFLPVRLEIPFYIFKFYDYFTYCALFAESSLWGSGGGGDDGGKIFNPNEVGIKLLIHSPSSNTSPLEIRLGYLLFRSYKDETTDLGKTRYFRYEKYQTFYIGATIHVGW